MEKIKLELKKVSTVMIPFNGKEIEVRPYLEQWEIDSIVDTALREKDFIKRQIGINVDVLNFCTNIDLEGVEYDLLVGNRIVDEVICRIINYEDIDKYIKKYEDMTSVMANVGKDFSDFLEDMKKRLPKKINIKKIVEDIKKGV